MASLVAALPVAGVRAAAAAPVVLPAAASPVAGVRAAAAAPVASPVVASLVEGGRAAPVVLLVAALPVAGVRAAAAAPVVLPAAASPVAAAWGGLAVRAGLAACPGAAPPGAPRERRRAVPGCQSYQYCNGTKCLPEYRSTKLLSLEPAVGADQVFYALPAAIVASNGDLFLQARIQGRITYSTTALGGSLGSTAEFTDLMTVARMSASGVLQWARDMAFILGDRANSLYTSSISLASNDDVLVAYTRTDPPPPPPGTPTAQTRLGRIDGGNPTLLWEASYGNLALAGKVIARSARGDFLTVGFAPNQFQGCCDKVVQVSAGGATATILGDYYAYGALPGRDGSTVWMFGAYAGTLRLNPWSSMTWNVPANPNQLGLYDAFIIGAKDDGTNFGPWVTQGDIGPTLAGLVLAADGNPIISLGGSAPTRINGQDLLQGEGRVLAKLNAATGALMWKTDTTDASGMLVATGDGSIALVSGSPSSVVRLYASGDGVARASFQVPGTVHHVVAGSSNLFVVGVIQGSTDFNPGTVVDTQGTTAPACYSLQILVLSCHIRGSHAEPGPGPRGNVWFTEPEAGRIGRLVPS